MKDAVLSAAKLVVMLQEGDATSVTTPARRVLMRDLTSAPAVTQVCQPAAPVREHGVSLFFFFSPST